MNLKRLRANPKVREHWEEICEIILNAKWFFRALKIYIQVPKSEKGNLLTFEWIALKSQSFMFWNRNFCLPFTYVFVCVFDFPAFLLFLSLNLVALTFSLTVFSFFGVFIIFVDSSAYEYKIYQVTSGYHITVLTDCWETFPLTSSPLPRFRL